MGGLSGERAVKMRVLSRREEVERMGWYMPPEWISSAGDEERLFVFWILRVSVHDSCITFVAIHAQVPFCGRCICPKQD